MNIDFKKMFKFWIGLSLLLFIITMIADYAVPDGRPGLIGHLLAIFFIPTLLCFGRILLEWIEND